MVLIQPESNCLCFVFSSISQREEVPVMSYLLQVKRAHSKMGHLLKERVENIIPFLVLKAPSEIGGKVFLLEIPPLEQLPFSLRDCTHRQSAPVSALIPHYQLHTGNK